MLPVTGSADLRERIARMGKGSQVNEVLIADAVAMVRASWRAGVLDGSRSPLTFHTYMAVLARFERFARAYDAELIGQITPALLTLWVNADGRDRSGAMGAPKPATVRCRRLVVRAFFAEMRAIHGLLADPTDAVPAPARPVAERRPITEDEAEALLFFAAGAGVDGGGIGARASTVALALSGMHTAEISFVALSGVTDIDAEHGLVATPGSRRILARRVPVSGDRWRVIRQRAELLRRNHVEADHDQILLSRTKTADRLRAMTLETPHNHQAAIGTQLRFVLDLAGLSQSDGVRPESLPAYAGLRALTETGKIENAARLLGFASLDHTAAFIGWDWGGDPE